MRSLVPFVLLPFLATSCSILMKDPALVKDLVETAEEIVKDYEQEK